MIEFNFINNKCFEIVSKKKSPCRLKLKDAICSKQVNKIGSYYFIEIKLEGTFRDFVNSVQNTANNKVPQTVAFISNPNYILVKIPFRYNKFECDVNYKNSTQTVYDISVGNKINIDLTLKSLWWNNEHGYLTWIANSITKQ